MANTIHSASIEIGKILAGLNKFLQEVSETRSLFRVLGWELPPGLEDIGLAGLDFSILSNKLKIILDASKQELDDEILMAKRIADLAVELRNVISTIQQFADNLPIQLSQFDDYVERTKIHKELPKRLFNFWLTTMLSGYSLPTFSLLNLLNIIEYKHFDADEENFQVAHVRPIIHYGGFNSLISDASAHFENAYGWGTPNFAGHDLLFRLSRLLESLGLSVFLRPMDQRAIAVLTGAPELTEEEAKTSFQLIITFFEELAENAGIKLALSVFNIQPGSDGAADGGIGFLPVVRGHLEGEIPFFIFEDVYLTFSAEAETLRRIALVLRPGQSIQVQKAASLDELFTGRFALGFRQGSLDGPPQVLLALPGGAGIHMRQFTLTGGIEKYSDRQDESFVELGLWGCEATLSMSESDGFLSSIIPEDKINAPFDLRIGWTRSQGIYFRGSAGLGLSIPVQIQKGPFRLHALQLALAAGDEDLSLEVSATGSVLLGPVTATIDRLGLVLDVTLGKGNLGLFGLFPQFKPPIGIGLTIDGGGFKGGGFLRFEPEAARYTGVLELEFKDKIALKAIGLLETRLPNNQPGYTLLILITAEFTPVQLGFGFTLNGVGGLLALHRMVDIERLRTGIRDNTLSNILFPQNIVENAERIISDLRQVFPPQEGRFVFGPMARIGWGSPTILTIDLGLLIEVPNPVRLAILGVLKGILPKEEAPVLRLQVNFLGEINLEKQQLSFDASLYDSKLLSFTLTGDMAIRLYWGDDPNFLLTVGGFHPAYQPPPMNLPDIRRITLALTEGDNPRLRLETYFAVTSNTVQFGAKAELYASAWKFNVSGFISFDVLFQFSPFRFIAEVSAMLALSVGSSPFASIQLAFALEGPTPWSAKGTASFKICWFFTLKIRFSKTWGESRNESLPDVAVMPLLLAALNDNNNWVAELPRGRHLLVSTREVIPAAGAEQHIIAQPYGVLNISQKVVPLNLSIQKFGNLRPADGNLFKISGVQVGENTSIANPEAAKEFFAPAQFFEKSDAEKLSDKSFERYDSGIRLSENGQLKSDYATARKVKYEVNYIDSQLNQRLSKQDKELYQPDVGAFNTWALQGAVSKSDLSHARNRKPALAPGAVSLAQERYGVVNSGDLSLFDGESMVLSEAEAIAKHETVKRKNPGLRERLQVVNIFEIIN